jgi:hypothetical protein
MRDAVRNCEDSTASGNDVDEALMEDTKIEVTHSLK